MKNIKSGDLLAIEGKTPLSALIRAFDGGKFSHVGIAYVTGSSVKIIEAVPGDDTAVNDLAHYKGCKVTAYRATKQAEQQAELADTALELVGITPYEFGELARAAANQADDGNIKDGLVCSQLVAHVYDKCGYKLDANEHGFHTPNSVVQGLELVSEVQL